MSYTSSECSCDWCNGEISQKRNDNLACSDCYETIESENADLKKEIGELEERIRELEMNL